MSAVLKLHPETSEAFMEGFPLTVAVNSPDFGAVVYLSAASPFKRTEEGTPRVRLK